MNESGPKETGAEAAAITRRTTLIGAALPIIDGVAWPAAAQSSNGRETVQELRTLEPFWQDTPSILIDSRIRSLFESLLVESPTTHFSSPETAPTQLTLERKTGTLTMHTPGHTMIWEKKPEDDMVIAPVTGDFAVLGVIGISYGREPNLRTDVMIGRMLDGRLRVLDVGMDVQRRSPRQSGTGVQHGK